MLFSQGKKLPKSLDDGVRPTKKQKKEANAAKAADTDADVIKAQAQALKAEMPTIRPGEKMSEFSARVDAALPISGLMNKSGRGGKDPLGLKQYRTKKEKQMHKMYAEWREQDAKIKEKRQEALELAQEMEDDEDEGDRRWKKGDGEDEEADAAGDKKKKGGKKRKKMLGEVNDGDDDPWAELKKKRNEKPIGLNDVAQAPPELKAPKAKFKIREGAMVEVGDIPKASGSLRRREELSSVRQGIIDGYRQMMKQKQVPEEK